MSVKLIILGLLMGGEKHPYEMQHIMKIRKMDKFISLYKGSIYYAVEQIKGEGFIEVSSIIKEDKRPDKTVYKITEEGRSEFQRLLMEQVTKEEQFYEPIFTALVFAHYSDSSEFANAIGQKITYIEDKIRIMENIYEEVKPTVPRSVHYIYISLIENAKTELKWLRNLREDALEGRLGLCQ